jgi:hypothetical protein
MCLLGGSFGLRKHFYGWKVFSRVSMQDVLVVSG